MANMVSKQGVCMYTGKPQGNCMYKLKKHSVCTKLKPVDRNKNNGLVLNDETL